MLPLLNISKVWKSSLLFGLFLFLHQCCYADYTATCSQGLTFGNISLIRVVPLIQITVHTNDTYSTDGNANVGGTPSAAHCRIYGPVGATVQIVPSSSAALGNSSLVVNNFTTSWTNNTCEINQYGWCDISIGATLNINNGILGSYNTNISMTLQ